MKHSHEQHEQQQDQHHHHGHHQHGDREHGHADHDHCVTIPRFERINYFHGQMLGVKEFQAEQSYFHEKQRLHNRFLHGYGVVCGLAVKPCVARPDPCAPQPEPPRPPEPVPAPPPPVPKPAPKPGSKRSPKQSAEQSVEQHEGDTTTALVPMQSRVPQQRIAGRPCVEIDCGLALTCEGDEIVVRSPVQIDLWKELDDEAREQLESGAAKGVWIKICYRECPTLLARPVTLDTCTGLPAHCIPSRVREGFCVKVEVARDGDKPHDCACSPCEERCESPCLVLALVKHVSPGMMVLESDIDNGVRRPVSLFETTRITGISWTHGATYSREEADKLLDEGIEIEFSHPVHGETITPGVLELWGVEGGEGRSGQVFHIGSELIGGQPSGMVKSVRYRRNTRERLNVGDRVLIIFRSAFVLDHCCRPVDGEHVGGRVPIILPKYNEWDRAPVHTVCESPAHRGYRPWQSGNGVPGGTFESWFFID